MKFKNPKTGRAYDLRDGVVVSGFCNHRACKDCPIYNKDTGKSCVDRIYEAPYDTAYKMGYEVLEQDSDLEDITRPVRNMISYNPGTGE